MIRKMIRKIIGVLVAVCLSTYVLAHTSLKTSQPESGSILKASPESVTLEFAKPVRLTRLRIEATNTEERELDFSPDAVSAEFTTASPKLAPGRNAIHWTALSPDGHVIEGTIILVLSPDG